MNTDLDNVMQQAYEGFLQFQNVSGADKKTFLYTIAEEIEALGDALIEAASEETNLPNGRFVGERARSCMQLKMFGDLVAEGSWLEAVIETSEPDRKPLPKPDMRKMNIGLGPILVFGASNFPLAYSTPGGDTASALAAGCSVVVKGHPAHPKTSKMVAHAITTAVAKCGLHPYVFQHIEGDSFEIGRTLTMHPRTAGVGFTGSLAGGRAIYDYASQREVPIPVFSEMGSTNPVLLLQDVLNTKAKQIAESLANSITLGVGQFCTNPGILLGIKSSGLNNFTNILAIELSLKSSFKMLHKNIHSSYVAKVNQALAAKGVETIYHGSAEDSMAASPVLARVKGSDFLKNNELHHEVFGPYSIIVVCDNLSEMVAVWQSLHGQLTTTFMGTPDDFAKYKDIINLAKNIAGRVIFNGTPTGVEVNSATVHGGPYPSTTDPRFTSVGADAIKRWVRPVCYQDCPNEYLPSELKNENPLKIWRKVNNQFHKESI